MTEIDFLPEELKTIKNLCDIAQILINIERRELLPTVLETIFEEAQHILANYCIVD